VCWIGCARASEIVNGRRSITADAAPRRTIQPRVMIVHGVFAPIVMRVSVPVFEPDPLIDDDGLELAP
jgi:hypothetical protein